MGDDSRGERRRLGPLPGGEDGKDRISCLPDELLHTILVCLGSARAAAQTAVLSSRWRRVWTHLPELFLWGRKGPAASFLDTVDAALAASAAPTLKRLLISVRSRKKDSPGLPTHRVAPWLRFASQRVAGDIFLNLDPDERSFVKGYYTLETTAAGEEEAEAELPACETATTITLKTSMKLRLAGGVFAALTDLVLKYARVDGTELSNLVSTQCPRLRKLDLLVELVAASDVTIHSNSLHSLCFFAGNTGRLVVVAPRLEELDLTCLRMQTHITAPNLANVTWFGDAYDPRLHQFAHIRGRLRLLDLGLIGSTTTLLNEQFNEVDELRLSIDIPEGIEGYKWFLNLTNKLPKCETIRIYIDCYEHGFTPAIFHLFRGCNSIKKLSIVLVTDSSLMYSCPLACPCRLVESSMFDDIALGSLEEVQINCFEGTQEEMEFVEQLSKCNAPVLEQLVINYVKEYDPSPSTRELCEKVWSLCRPNLKVEFCVISKGRPVHFYTLPPLVENAM